MQIIHPQGMYNGLNPEDVFIVVDDMGVELGQGYIIYRPFAQARRTIFHIKARVLQSNTRVKVYNYTIFIAKRVKG